MCLFSDALGGAFVLRSIGLPEMVGKAQNTYWYARFESEKNGPCVSIRLDMLPGRSVRFIRRMEHFV